LQEQYWVTGQYHKAGASVKTTNTPIPIFAVEEDAITVEKVK